MSGLQIKILVAVGLLVAGGFGHNWYSGHYVRQGRALERADRADADRRTEAIARGVAESQRTETERLSHEIEVLRSQRDKDAADFRTALQPVRLCIAAAPRTESAGTIAVAPAATDGTGGAEGLSLLGSEDISAELGLFVESCQRDNDDKFAWRRYSARQAKLIDDLYLTLGETLK